MTDVGPSTSTGRLTEEQLLELEERFQSGVQCIKTNEIEAAVRLFHEVLIARIKHYGETAPECASAFYRYGSALLYQAQDAADVFGGPIRGQAEEDKENGLGLIKQDDDEPGPSNAVTGDEQRNHQSTDHDKTAAAAAPAGGGIGQMDAQGDGDEEDAPVEGDLQLAWENLEMARTIWSKDAPANAEQLSSVHLLLGDVNMENEAFEEALVDFDAAAEYQDAAGFALDDRRRAELQFKRCTAAQFLGRLDEALEAVKKAIQILQQKKASLEATGESIEDVDAVLEELKEKVEELDNAVKENEATKMVMKDAMAHLTAAITAQGGGSDATTNPLGLATSTSGADNQNQPRSTGASTPIKDLGVVGRGTKRINLAPVAAIGGTNDVDAEPAKKKRSLDDLMGGGVSNAGNAETMVGFGPSCGDEKQVKAEDAASAKAAPVPAFLQAYNSKNNQ